MLSLASRAVVFPVLTHPLTELFADYPRLTREDVQACLAYAQTLVEREKKAAKPVPSV